MYNKLFDFDGDGKLDPGEQALEYMTFRAVTGADEEEETDDADSDDDM